MDALTDAARLFGRALAELAEERGELQAVTEDLRAARDAVALPEFKAFLTNPIVPRRVKMDLLDQVFTGRTSDTFRLFLRTIVAKRRERILQQIVAAALHQCLVKLGYEVVLVTSAARLDADHETMIQEALAKALGRPVQAEFRVDPGLIGGIAIRRGDSLLDASVLGILERIGGLLTAGTAGGVGEYGDNGF